MLIYFDALSDFLFIISFMKLFLLVRNYCRFLLLLLPFSLSSSQSAAPYFQDHFPFLMDLCVWFRCFSESVFFFLSAHPNNAYAPAASSDTRCSKFPYVVGIEFSAASDFFLVSLFEDRLPNVRVEFSHRPRLLVHSVVVIHGLFAVVL